ncbi:energy transducer TonB [Phorcysia thermohydrogeniphila]|uniref:Protein TonB n=1 Tax=Phorcysia thermohydrogeniphila TaxID=936138 RepID=A0A4R1GE21_9BACT|nr:energy transducer TonB [Phorcysia thermohydrogeniphila]TCK06404.1 protein TonB [Phorcysia thermohydrogeniphila]
MRAPVRLLIALAVATLLEAGFFFISKSVIKPPKREVKRVIKISLLKPQRRTVTVKREVGQPVKRRTPPPPPQKSKPKLSSQKPAKQLPDKKKRVKKERKQKKPGGLKPLQGNLPLSYVEAVKSAIEENIFYPLEAIEKGEEGIVEVKFTLNRQGKVLSCKPVKGASRILMEATCIAIERAKFPPIPESVKNRTLSFQLEIEYNLKKAFGGA